MTVSSYSSASWRCRTWLVIAWFFATAVLGGCRSSVDPGNVDAFCDLITSGASLAGADADPAALRSLAAVSPPEIRPTVERLSQSATELDEVDDNDLDALFAARFDPDAAGAKEQLTSYSRSTCGVEPGGSLTVDPSEVQALMNYLELSAAGRPWLETIHVVPQGVEGQTESVRVSFLAEPDPGSAEEVCTNVSGWLYGTVGGSGAVTVDYEGVILAQRVGPDGSCTATGG